MFCYLSYVRIDFNTCPRKRLSTLCNDERVLLTMVFLKIFRSWVYKEF